MKIFCKQQKQWEPSQLVNRVGRYIYDHIDDAYNCVRTSNTCDVYMHVMYRDKSVEHEGRTHGRGYNDVSVMSINVSITTYSHKLRVNVIEIDPFERTLGFDLYDPIAIGGDIVNLANLIYTKVKKRIERAYKEYEFIW